MVQKSFSILHISDLHRSSADPITNADLISALVRDRDRYIRERPPIAAPEAVVVSGDIIQGVSLGTNDFASQIDQQYAIAEEFLDELARRFLEGDRSRLVMVPGNHDVDWNTAFNALAPVEPEQIPDSLRYELYSDDSLLRWDWRTQTLYRIADPDLYDRRLDAFCRFSERFYQALPDVPPSQSPTDVRLFSLCHDRIGLAAYNSCHRNDCFAFHGMIREGAIARSDLDLTDSGHVYDLRIAVWHHSIEGSPYRTDYMDVDLVRGMIGRGFRLGLHGHQHKAQATAQSILLPDMERMAVVSAGSLCAGASDLPVGTHRQYNVLEIAPDFRGVRIHVRAMTVANLFSRAFLANLGGRSFIDLDWEPPRNAVGQIVDSALIRGHAVTTRAEEALKSGRPSEAVAMLAPILREPGSYERQLFLDAARASHDWRGIVDATSTPTGIDELVQRFEALLRLGDIERAISDLHRFSQQLNLPPALKAELLGRAKAQEAIKNEC